MRIAVTGAAGTLGQRLLHAFEPGDALHAILHLSPIHGSAPQNVGASYCDLTRQDDVRDTFEAIHPDVVINCAALADVDRCETESALAHEVNAGAVANILSSIDPAHTLFVQLSTDYIFDGFEGPYPEDALPRPINEYGRTKLKAERAVSEWSGKWLIVRTSALYDCHLHQEANIFAPIYKALSRGLPVMAADDLHCTPTWTVNLSSAIAELVRKQAIGVLNVAGRTVCTRFTFAMQIAAAFGFPRDLISRVNASDLGRKARRPMRAGLNSEKASGILTTRLVAPMEGFRSPVFSPE